MSETAVKLDVEETPMDFRFEFEASVDVIEASSSETAPSFSASEEEQKQAYEDAHPKQEIEEDSGDSIQFIRGKIVGIGLDLTEVPADVVVRFGGQQVESIDLSHNLLTEVAALSAFTSATSLNLDNNFITESSPLPALPSLHTLTLNKNRIAEIDPLLSSLIALYPGLRYLSLLGNVACPNELVEKDDDDYKRYRIYVIFKLPGLKFLDSRPVTDAERRLAQERGSFLKVVKFTEEDVCQSCDYQISVDKVEQVAAKSAKSSSSSSLDPEYTPLPKDSKKQETKATIGTARYIYYGRHSEGNRFIRNDDL